MARYFSASALLLLASSVLALLGCAVPSAAETDTSTNHRSLANPDQNSDQVNWSVTLPSHRCVGSSLPPGGTLHPGEYICAYDPDDGTKLRFGLNYIGIVLFYRDDDVLWSAKRRGEYLRFEETSLLVLYSHGGTRVAWSTQCFGRGARGKVAELNVNGVQTKPGLLLKDKGNKDVWFLGTDGVLAGCYPDPKLLLPSAPTGRPTEQPVATADPTADPTWSPTADWKDVEEDVEEEDVEEDVEFSSNEIDENAEDTTDAVDLLDKLLQPPPALDVAVDCDRLRGNATLHSDPALTIKFNVRTPQHNQRAIFPPDQIAAGGIIDVHLLYAGEGYVAVGPSRDGQGGMVGSEVVMCLPATPDTDADVSKYFLNGLVRGGEVTEIIPMKHQTLTDAKIEQKNGVTKCSFTKLLRESGEIPIHAPYGRSTFVWAVGNEADEEYHVQGSFAVDFGACYPDGVPEEFFVGEEGGENANTEVIDDVVAEIQEEEEVQEEEEEEEEQVDTEVMGDDRGTIDDVLENIQEEGQQEELLEELLAQIQEAEEEQDDADQGVDVDLNAEDDVTFEGTEEVEKEEAEGLVATLPGGIKLELPAHWRPVNTDPTMMPTISPSKSPVVPVLATQMTSLPTVSVAEATTPSPTASATEEDTEAYVPPPASNDPGLTQIFVMGDAPFNDKEMTYWVPKQIDKVAYDADFLFHAGNQMRPAASNCNIMWNKFMRDTALGKSPVPVFITPGENDYVQCRGKIEDSDNDVEVAWENWKHTYLHLDKRWKHNLPVVYQEGREENFSILTKRSLIFSVHMINGPVYDEGEWADRHLDNYNFIKEQLETHAGEFDAVVILSHAKPEDTHRDFWSRMTFTIVTNPDLKTTPFVYVHGGGNGIYEEEERFLNMKNMLRVQIEGRKRNPINLMIDTTSPNPVVKIDRNDKTVWSVCCNPWLQGWPADPL